MRSNFLIAIALIALVGISPAAQAACRPEAGRACDRVIDPAATKVIQLGPNRFAIQLALAQGVQFKCNSSLVALPPNCPKDGVQFKDNISTNITAAAPNAALCTLYEGTTARPGATNFGFRVRFELNNSPFRKTCIINFTMPADFPGQRNLPFTLVNATNVAPEE